MKRVTLIAAGCFVTLLAVSTLNVAAQDLNPQERTFLTFSNMFQLPGMTLPAGTYTFRLADSSSRNVVQVLSQDGKKVFGQFLFVQKDRLDVSPETVVTFKEMPAGTTPAIQYWFYPNEKTGKEFIYPKEQALRIARATGQTVLSDDGPVTAETQASAADTAPAPESTVAENTARVPSPSAPSRPVGTSGAQAVPSSTQAELPRTASPLFFSGLLGLLSLAGALKLRFAR